MGGGKPLEPLMTSRRFGQFSHLVEASLAGISLSRDDAFSVLGTEDRDVTKLLEAAFVVRAQYFGRKVKICVLQNARSGLCPEDCHYCSQSAISRARIPIYRLLTQDELLEGARRAVAAGARRYCMVTSGRGPTEADVQHFTQAARAIKRQFPNLEICLSLGLTSEDQARALKAAGVGWVNHNLNTSRRFYPAICSTHTYDDRVETVRNVRRAGLMTCSGGIMGMGESDEDVVDLAFAVRELEVDSIPVNFLYQIPGTPLADVRRLSPAEGLKALCLFRFLNPRSEIRMAAGREIHLKDSQFLALYAANSIFVEGYLTTPGQKAEDAKRMIVDAGFEIEGETV